MATFIVREVRLVEVVTEVDTAEAIEAAFATYAQNREEGVITTEIELISPLRTKIESAIRCVASRLSCSASWTNRWGVPFYFSGSR